MGQQLEEDWEIMMRRKLSQLMTTIKVGTTLLGKCITFFAFFLLQQNTKASKI